MGPGPEVFAKFATAEPQPPLEMEPVFGKGKATWNSLKVGWKAPSEQSLRGAPLTGFTLRWRLAYSTWTEVFCNAEADKIEWQLSDLECEQLYSFTITAHNSAGESAASEVSQLSTAGPLLPENMEPPSLTAADWRSLSLEWFPPVSLGAPITAYSMRWKQGDDGDWHDEVAELFLQSKTIKNLEAGKKHVVGVKAHNKAGAGPWAYGFFVPPPDVPAKMQPPQRMKSSCTSITVQWEAPQPRGSPVLGYTLYYTVDSNRQEVKIEDPSILQYPVEGLSPETNVGFEVLANSIVGDGDCSRLVHFMTHDPPVPAVMPAPYLVEATWQTLTVAWDEPQDVGTPVTGYSLRWKLIDDGSDEARVVAGRGWQREMYHCDQKSFTIPRVFAGKKHMIGVVAHNKIGTGGEGVATFTPPATVPARMLPVTLASLSTSRVAISWTDGEPRGSPIAYYTVTSETSDDTQVQQIDVSSPNKCEVTGLRPGTTIQFTVAAVNKIGAGETSSVTSFVTLPPQPPLQMDPPLLLHVDHHSLKLQWNEPETDGADVTGYLLKLVQGGANNGAVKLVAEVATDADTLTTTIEDLEEFTPYVAVIQADSLAGPSKFSRPVAFQTCQENPVPYAEIVRIVDAMRDILRGEIQEWGCKSLHQIAATSTDSAIAVSQLGAVPRVVRAMYAYPKSVNIHDFGGRCLREVCDWRIPDAGLLSIKANTEVYDLLLQMRNPPWRADTQGTAKHVITLFEKAHPRTPKRPDGPMPPDCDAPEPAEPAVDKIARQLSQALDNDPRHSIAKFEQGNDVGMVVPSAWESTQRPSWESIGN